MVGGARGPAPDRPRAAPDGARPAARGDRPGPRPGHRAARAPAGPPAAGRRRLPRALPPGRRARRHVPAPPRRRRPGSRWRRLALDARAWRYAGHLAVVSTLGVLGGALVLGLTGTGLAALFASVLADGSLSLPYGIPGTLDAPGPVVPAVGVLMLLVAPPVARAVTAVEVRTARALLGGAREQREAALRRRVETLTQTRSRTVDSVEAERRRIERDLHDGPQQRLVSLSMQLGMAKRALERGGPDAARDLLDAASTSASAAIADMRHVARGIHPPVLTDRGIDAAVSALAASSPVPVDVEVHFPPEHRPSPTAEAIAYFCVSEALTNTAKHARASRAVVQVWREGAAGPRGGDLLRLRVSDDGVGGAVPAGGTVADGGSGLRGLGDRLAAVDGWLRVDSPPGGPTVLEAGVPWTVGGAR
ncbi:sensor histidine kinase [Kineococcus indalonis]|uniref:sensor histidine kinase n=1 Tax=Kineococcus indalonis TaxID=2696566 RepID=UPI0014136362|nr:histidine kinase [Kineococcus indalonis]NAZ86975.1 sensor histidine kinase [Kineococcus indalonis]